MRRKKHPKDVRRTGRCRKQGCLQCHAEKILDLPRVKYRHEPSLREEVALAQEQWHQDITDEEQWIRYEEESAEADFLHDLMEDIVVSPDGEARYEDDSPGGEFAYHRAWKPARVQRFDRHGRELPMPRFFARMNAGLKGGLE